MGMSPSKPFAPLLAHLTTPSDASLKRSFDVRCFTDMMRTCQYPIPEGNNANPSRTVKLVISTTQLVCNDGPDRLYLRGVAEISMNRHCSGPSGRLCQSQARGRKTIVIFPISSIWHSTYECYALMSSHTVYRITITHLNAHLQGSYGVREEKISILFPIHSTHKWSVFCKSLEQSDILVLTGKRSRCDQCIFIKVHEMT